MKPISKLLFWLLALAALSPMGLLLPGFFKGGTAWGEWSAGGIKTLVGYMPQGLEKLSSLWNAPIPGYAFKGWERKGLAQLSFSYIVSAIIGIAAVILIVWFIARILIKNNK